MSRGEWTDPARSRVSVGEWSREWMASRSVSLKATTVESYRSLLERCVSPTWERVPLASVRHADVAAWVGRLAGQVGPSRCRKAATLLRGIMAAAVRDQRLSRNPCVSVSLPASSGTASAVLDDGGAAAVGRARGLVSAMVLVLGVCGLRFGECAALRVRSVDLLRLAASIVGGRLGCE